jgi:D-lactate dehydrogenase
VITLHAPLLPDTHHLIDDAFINRCTPGVVLIIASRGGLVDTAALIRGLESGRIGGAGLDVYEDEAGLFFEDHSGEVLPDRMFANLSSFPNVLITSHQGFLTTNALHDIAAPSGTLPLLRRSTRTRRDLADGVDACRDPATRSIRSAKWDCALLV